MTITIDQIRVEKKCLERAISELMYGFSKRTGVPVLAIDVSQIEATRLESVRREFLSTVKVRLADALNDD